MTPTNPVSREAIRAVVLAAVMVLSVFGGTMAAAGTAASDSGAAVAPIEDGSAKSMSLSWFREEGNGPYPVMPSEYEEDTTGIQMFGNAEGDSHISVDDSIARNPNGQWDMIVLHVEMDAADMEALDPPADGADKGLVTQNFIDSDDFDLTVEQTNGDKVLSVADNQQDYENPPVEAESDIPPVMVFADMDEVDDDFSTSADPDTGLLVWIDPNRAVLDENGEEASFETGEEYSFEFEVNGETDGSTFETVDGSVTLDEPVEAENVVSAEVGGETNLAHGTELQFDLELEDGTTMTKRVDVEGDDNPFGVDNPGTMPTSPVTAGFDLTGQENKEFTLTVYAPGPEGGHSDGSPVRDDDDWFTEENRIQVAQSSGVVEDAVIEDYTIENASVTDGKPLSLPLGISDHATAPEIGESVGDGEVAYDNSTAFDVQGTQQWDWMWLHYETTGPIGEAISKSPGESIAEKFHNAPMSLEVVQTNPGTSQQAKELNITRDDSGVIVIPDSGQSDDRLYTTHDQGIFFFIDFNEATLFRGDEEVEAQPGETYEATFSVETEEGVEEETIEFELVEGETWFAGEEEGDVVELPQSENAEITLVTELAAGGEWSINVTSEDGSIDERTVDNVPEGDQVLAGKIGGSMPTATTTITIDTTDLEVGTQLDLSASLEDDPPGAPIDVHEATAEIVPPPSASVSISDQSGDGETVTIDSVELTDGGFVAVRTGGVSGVTKGSSGYLEEGEHTDLEITLDEPLEEDDTITVVVHQDTDGDQELTFPLADDPYQDEGGNSVAADAEYTVESGQTETETATATDDDTPTDDATPTDDTVEDTPGGEDLMTETTTASDGQPGFGIVAFLLAIALFGAWIALYRRD